MIGKLLLLRMAMERIRFPLWRSSCKLHDQGEDLQGRDDKIWVILHPFPHRSCCGAHLGLLPLLFAHLWASEDVDRGAIGQQDLHAQYAEMELAHVTKPQHDHMAVKCCQ